ncbi:MAG: ribonuclease HI [Alphaproteobacteria bacterium CG_4_10_14_0_8_um_filter_53_9]|nr:MAG: ribonuclease HI [Alphaproteobacteria bacterium CG_4_10_14_0_8_um_filter_53_9]
MKSDEKQALPHVKIYTDGACSGNPGPGGWAYLIVWNDHQKQGSGGVKHTTNNRMELTSPAEALKALKEPCKADIYTDSQYVQKGMTEWVKGWIRKGWKNSQNKPVENREYWENLIAAAAPHQVKWHWVKGHAGHPENELVDELAVAAIPR